MISKDIAASDSNANYQFFLEHAPDGVVMIDQYNKIQFWNPKAEAIFGWTAAEVIGKTLSNIIVPPAFREAHNNGMKRQLATGEVRVLNKTIEVPALHKNEKEFYISLTISRVELKGTISFLAFIRDITEQKNNQAQLELKTLELERSNQQLQEFASIASHDLKEPLRKIAMFVDVIITKENEALSEATKNNLQKIRDAARRMRQLTEGILSYSSFGTAVEKEQISLEVLLQDAVANLESRIKETNAVITSDGLPEAPVVALQLQQVFQNLLSNAIKFSKNDETPRINISHIILPWKEIQIKDLQHAAHYLQINFEDNGIGFSGEVTEKIFGLFQRLHGKSAYEGSGLGLAICRKIIENHKGTITATSEPDAGSTFTILLPL